MKFALIGIGKWGQNYIKAFKTMQSSELVAVSSKNKSSYSFLAPELQICPYVENLEEIFENKSIETVIVATHPDQHYHLSQAALTYGKNVICEKPFMMKNFESHTIEKLSKDLVFYTDYTNLHHTIIGKMKEIVEKIDTKPTIHLINTGSGPVRDLYSDIWDYGSHIFSIVYTLYPDTIFFNQSYSNDGDGNHRIFFDSLDMTLIATFGNKSKARKHLFELDHPSTSVSWKNDGSENPLKIMLESFARREIKSNLQLSQKIKESLIDCEHLNNKSKKQS